MLASEGRIEWQPVLCETNASPELIKSMQLALRQTGRIPGKIDGKLNAQTMARHPLFPAVERIAYRSTDPRDAPNSRSKNRASRLDGIMSRLC